MSKEEDSADDEAPNPELLEKLIQAGRRLTAALKQRNKEDRWSALVLLRCSVEGFAPQQRAAMSYLLREVLAYYRSAGERASVGDYLEFFDDALIHVILDSFRKDALEALSDAWGAGQCPQPEALLPEIPEGYDSEEGFGPSLYQELLTRYCRLCGERGNAGDLLTRSWERMPSRRRAYTMRLCRVFLLPLPGESVDKYKLLNLVGVGGMGAVYLALNTGVNRPVALKLMRPDCARVDRFRQEGRTHCKIDDRRVVVIRDGELRSGAERLYFTMDYVEGGRSLTDLIDGSSPPTAKELAKLLSTVAHAVEALHKQHFLHCDLKPGNVLISNKDGPLLSDLGLSRPLNEKGTAAKEPFAGTPAYTSPEQARGECLTPRSDVWGLGAILYRSLTGRAPFRKTRQEETDEETLRRVANDPVVPPSKIASRVPPDLEAICMRALHKKPMARYSSAGEMAADLLRYVNGDPVHARPGYRRREMVRTCLRSLWTYRLLGLLLVVSIGWPAYNYYQHEAYLNHQEVDGCVASTNRYRALDLVPPPEIEVLPVKDPRSAACLVGTLATPSGSGYLQAASLLGAGLLEGWPNPDYSHVIIKSSSLYFDLSRWKPIPPGTSPATADRSQGEPALYTRVIDLERKVSVSQERPTVSFQFRTEGYDVDLKCVTHPYRVLGSPAREPLGGGTKPVLIREVEVDLSAVPKGEATRVVIHGTIWNGFQRNPPLLHSAVALLAAQPWAVCANAIIADDSHQWAAFLAPDALSEGELAVKFPKNLKPSQPPKLLFFKKGSPKQEEPLGTQNFHNPRHKDWWVWRPRDIRRGYVYQIGWSWKPIQSP